MTRWHAWVSTANGDKTEFLVAGSRIKGLDEGLRDMIMMCYLIILRLAFLLCQLVPGCTSDSVRRPRQIAYEYSPGHYASTGTSGGGDLFLGTLCSLLGAVLRPDLVIIGVVTLRGKLVAVSTT